MKKVFTALLIIIFINANAQIISESLIEHATATNRFNFFDYSKQSEIRIDSGLSEKLSNNQKIFNSNRCDIYVKSIRDSVEVCIYFYSKDTLIINGVKTSYKNKFKHEAKKQD